MSQDGIYGDGVMLSGAVHLYNRPITIIQQDGNIFTIDAPNVSSSATPMHLGYVRSNPRKMQLDHYVSLSQTIMDRTTENTGL